MKFEVHTYGADTPHRGKKNIPLLVSADTAQAAERAARTERPLSHLYMTQPIERKTKCMPA